MEHKLNIIAIIQARMGSSRLPGKVLLEIEGNKLLELIVKRVSSSKYISKIIVATTLLSEDDELEKYAKNNLKCDIYRGSSNNVLNRFYEAAKLNNADLIVRITADDPLKDPYIIDQAIEIMLSNNKLDYCSNTIEPTYPEGLDIEVFKFTALKIANFEANLKSECEHVTPFIWKNPKRFNIQNFKFERNLSSWRWTVDKQEDLEFFRCIFNEFKNKPLVNYREVIKFLETNPEIMKINSGTIRNEGYIKSLIQES